jgi:molybdopterin synthase sulfur carrier subunit
MTVRVLFFSVLKDITGVEETPWECADGATMADLLSELFAKWPRLAEWDRSLLVAIDHAYVKREAPLKNGCEVAIMPPVQGG